MCDRCSSEDILAWREGRLDAAAAAALEAHVVECVDCRQIDRLVQSLRCAVSPESAPTAATDGHVLHVIDRLHRRRRARRRFGWAAAACLAAISVSWWLFSPPGRGPATLAEIHGDVVVERNGKTFTAAEGAVLRPLDRVIIASDGSAVMSLPDAARVEMGSRTTVQWTGADEGALILHQGFLAIDAAPRNADRILHVRTPSADAAVVGTRFSVAATEENTSLRVAEGQVRVTRNRDGAETTVPAGHRVSVTARAGFAPIPSRSGDVLLIVTRQRRVPDPERVKPWHRFNRNLEARLMGDQLQRHAFRVTIKEHFELRPEDLLNRSLVIVSLADDKVGFEEMLERAGVPEAAVPVLCLEPVAYPTLGLSGSRFDADYGWNRPTVPVFVRRPEHPLAVGQDLTSQALFHSGAGLYGWARPGPDADVVVAAADQPERAIVFAYETGTRMIGRRAPARRVGLFFDPDFAGDRDGAVWKLVDAAAEWCAQPSPRAALDRAAAPASFALNRGDFPGNPR